MFQDKYVFVQLAFFLDRDHLNWHTSMMVTKVCEASLLLESVAFMKHNRIFSTKLISKMTKSKAILVNQIYLFTSIFRGQ